MQISRLHISDSTFNLPAIAITLPLIANLFSRNIAEYLFDLLIVAVLFWTQTRRYGMNWASFRNGCAFRYIWPTLLATLVIGHLINGTLGLQQIGELMQYLWILGFYCLLQALRAAAFPKRLFRMTCIFLIVLSGFLILNFFIYPPDTPATWGLPNRLRGPFTNTNFLAHSYFLVFIFLFAQIISRLEKDSEDFLYSLAATVSLAVVLFLTFNRSIWITGIAIVPILSHYWRRWAGPVTFALLVGLFASLYLGNIGGFHNRIQNTVTLNHPSDEPRRNLWKANWYIFKEHPLFGVGYNNNTRDITKYYDHLGLVNNTEATHSHNQILSFLAGSGLVGALLYLSLFVYFGILAWKTIPFVSKNRPTERGLIIGAFAAQPAFILAGIADNNFDIHVARMFLIASWSIIVFLSDKFRQKELLQHRAPAKTKNICTK